MQDGLDREGAQTEVAVCGAVVCDFGVGGEKVRGCLGTGESVEGAVEGVGGGSAEVDCAGGGRKHDSAGGGRRCHCVER